jgi:hypothetical protein
MIPSFHWPSTSIHEFMWNSKSWPDGIPRKKKGNTITNAVAMMIGGGRSSGFAGAELDSEGNVEQYTEAALGQ